LFDFDSRDVLEEKLGCRFNTTAAFTVSFCILSLLFVCVCVCMYENVCSIYIHLQGKMPCFRKWRSTCSTHIFSRQVLSNISLVEHAINMSRLCMLQTALMSALDVLLLMVNFWRMFCFYLSSPYYLPSPQILPSEWCTSR